MLISAKILKGCECDIKVTSNQTDKNKACVKLKEVHKILQRLNNQLAPPPPSRIPRLVSLQSSKDHKDPTRNNFSSTSKWQCMTRTLSNEELRKYLQTALQSLEEVIADIENATLVVQKYSDTDSLEAHSDCKDEDERSLNEVQKNKRSTSVQTEPINIEERISIFGKDETDLSATNCITDAEVSSDQKDLKHTEAIEMLSKHQTSLGSSFYDGVSFSTRKGSPSLKNVNSSASSLPNSRRNMNNVDLKEILRMTLQHLEEENSDENFEANNESAKFIYDDASCLKNYEGVQCKLPSNLQESNTNPFKRNSPTNHSTESKQITCSKSSSFVCEALKYHQENISSLKIDQSGLTLRELEKLWNEMIQTPIKSRSRIEQIAKVEQITKTETRKMTNKDVGSGKEFFNHAHSSENRESVSTSTYLNMNKIQPASTGRNVFGVDEFSKQTINPCKKKDFLKLSAMNKALSISISYGDDIKLDKDVQ